VNDYQAIEAELQRRREQADSVRGKRTPYRVEFRYPGGTKHWRYFEALEDTAGAEDSICGYGPTGQGFIRKPLSQQVQVQGPCGGWKKA